MLWLKSKLDIERKWIVKIWAYLVEWLVYYNRLRCGHSAKYAQVFFYNSLSFDVHFTFCMFTFMSQHDLAHKLKEKAERSWLLSVKKTTHYYAFNINFSFTLLGLGVKNYIFHTEIDLQTYFFKRWQNKFSSSSQHCQISILILQNWNPCLWHIFLLFSMQILTNEQRFQQL